MFIPSSCSLAVVEVGGVDIVPGITCLPEAASTYVVPFAGGWPSPSQIAWILAA